MTSATGSPACGVEDIAMTEKLSVFLIDDELIVNKRLKPALEKSGYEVETEQEGRAALERLQEKEFDVVVTDMRIDDMTGLQVLDTVKKHSKKTKVVLMTGYATMELARRALLQGAFEVIAKPFKPQELRDVIARAADALKSQNTHP